MKNRIILGMLLALAFGGCNQQSKNDKNTTDTVVTSCVSGYKADLIPSALSNTYFIIKKNNKKNPC